MRRVAWRHALLLQVLNSRELIEDTIDESGMQLENQMPIVRAASKCMTWVNGHDIMI